MAYIDTEALQALWTRIDDCFARLSEAGAHINFSLEGGNLYILLSASTGESLDSITVPCASSASCGLMSASDKEKLDSFESGGGSSYLTEANAQNYYAQKFRKDGNRLYLVAANGRDLDWVDL